MDLRFNQAIGWMAVVTVLAKGVRANNLPDASKMSQEEWSRLTACVTNVKLNATNIYHRASMAMEGRCGNCEEQTAIVVAFLQAVGARQIDLMILYGNTPRFAHVFVVLGRRAGTPANDPSKWGPDAVVIDPWHNRGNVFPAAEIDSKMFRGYHNFSGALQPESLLRID